MKIVERERKMSGAKGDGIFGSSYIYYREDRLVVTHWWMIVYSDKVKVLRSRNDSNER